jgi:hypothetical protein
MTLVARSLCHTARFFRRFLRILPFCHHRGIAHQRFDGHRNLRNQGRTVGGVYAARKVWHPSHRRPAEPMLRLDRLLTALEPERSDYG